MALLVVVSGWVGLGRLAMTWQWKGDRWGAYLVGITLLASPGIPLHTPDPKRHPHIPFEGEEITGLVGCSPGRYPPPPPTSLLAPSCCVLAIIQGLTSSLDREEGGFKVVVRHGPFCVGSCRW
jgi:hypothetical protein